MRNREAQVSIIYGESGTSHMKPNFERLLLATTNDTRV